MKKLLVVLLVMLSLGVAVSLTAETMKAHETALYSIDIPSDWNVVLDTDSLFTAVMGGESLTPVTVMVVVMEKEEDDIDMSLENAAEEALAEGNAELIAMGMEDAIDVVESGEVRFNGYTAYHSLVKISIMGMNISTDTYMLNHGENFIQLAFLGDDGQLTAQEALIATIKKSFSLK